MPSGRVFRRFFLIGVLWLTAGYTYAQCTPPAFTSPPAACLDQRLQFIPDNDYTSYNWDFCSGDLLQTPTGGLLNNQFGGYGSKLELAEQGGDYFGFTITRATGKLYRLNFGNSINNPPSITEVGGLGKNSTTWRAIEIVKEGTNYIGLIIDNHGLYRVNFGNDLTAVPTTTETIFENGPINTPIDMAVVQEANNRYVFISNLANDKLVRIKFNNAFNSTIPDVDVDAITVPGSILLSGISFIKDCETWYCMATSVAVGEVYRISFDDGLEDIMPTITEYAIGVTAGIAVVKESSQYLVFAQSPNSPPAIFRMNFGASMSGTPSAPTELKNYGITGGDMWGFSMYKVGTDWLVTSVENAGPGIYKSTFPNNCFSSTKTSTVKDPPVTSNHPGSFFTTLSVTGASGIESSITNALTVSSATAPAIDFSFDKFCANHDVDFTSANTTGDATTYDWDFGDGNSAASPSPTHQFLPGLYDVSLTVDASSTGCSNFTARPIKVYPPPVADFQVPGGLVCTNNDFTFTNNTADVYDGHLAYQWLVDGDPVGTMRNLVYAFTGTGDQPVELAVSIPGCFDEEVKTINGVLPGPAVDFSIDGQCEDREILFVNHSTGSIVSYGWDFGNSQTSNSINTSTSYDQAGAYLISLSATSDNGCVTVETKSHTVYTTPLPSFSLDLPPFSCAGTPSQFHDATPPPPDSNVNQWNWTFGDNQSGTGEDTTHVYSAAGTFNVRLTVTTDKGCSTFVEQPVSIAPSPTASFTVDPTCLNKSTHFTSTSTGDIESLQWRIGNQVYVVPNPTHVFAATGNFSAQLTVTGTNDCVNSVTKPLVVPVVPTIDFNVSNACSGQITTFNDVTSGTADPVAQRLWTFNSTTTTNGQQADFSFANAGTYPVKLDLTNQSGCVYSLTRQITINTSPLANFTMSDESGPPPLHVMFSNTSTGASSYQWDFNDGSAVKTETSQEYTFNALGDYDVSLKAAGAQGCTMTVTKTVSVIIPHAELALEEFSLVPSGSSYRGYVRVHNNGNYRISGFTLSYDVGGGILITENVSASLTPGQTGMILLSNQFNSPAAIGYICAELQHDTNLSDNKACTVFNDRSIVLTPFPNPANADLTIETIQPAAGTVRILLYTSSGGIAYDKTFDVSSGLSRLTLDLQNLSPGIYYALISAGDITTSRKILIHR